LAWSWLHLDRSKMLAAAGLKPTLLHAGAAKVDGNSLEALTPEARARIQDLIDNAYGLLVSSIGEHRPSLGAAGARRPRRVCTWARARSTPALPMASAI